MEGKKEEEEKKKKTSWHALAEQIVAPDSGHCTPGGVVSLMDMAGEHFGGRARWLTDGVYLSGVVAFVCDY